MVYSEYFYMELARELSSIVSLSLDKLLWPIVEKKKSNSEN